MSAEMRGLAPALRLQCTLCSGRQHQQMSITLVHVHSRDRLRSLVENHMGIRAAVARGMHSSPAGRWTSRPGGERGIHLERTVSEINLGIGSFKKQRRRKLLIFERERGFEQAGHAAGRARMADIGLYRAKGAKLAFWRAGAKRDRKSVV